MTRRSPALRRRGVVAVFGARFVGRVVRFGLFRFGVARFGLFRFGVARFGLFRFGVARFGPLRFGVGVGLTRGRRCVIVPPVRRGVVP